MYKVKVFSRLLCCVDCIVMVLLVSVISVLTVLLGPHAQVRGCEGFEQLNDLTLGCQTSNSASSSHFHHWPLLALLVALVLH